MKEPITKIDENLISNIKDKKVQSLNQNLLNSKNDKLIDKFKQSKKSINIRKNLINIVKTEIKDKDPDKAINVLKFYSQKIDLSQISSFDIVENKNINGTMNDKLTIKRYKEDEKINDTNDNYNDYEKFKSNVNNNINNIKSKKDISSSELSSEEENVKNK